MKKKRSRIRDNERINDIDAWIDWIVKDPETAEKLFPNTMKNLKESIRNSDPAMTVAIIQSVPRNFQVWKEQAEKLNGYEKRVFIQGQIQMIDTVLRKEGYFHDIENDAVKSIRNVLVEQRRYWNDLLNETK